MKRVLAFVFSHLGAVAIAAGIVYLAVDRAHEKSLRAQVQAEAQKSLDEKAKELGATKAQVQSERQIIAGLQGQMASLVAALKKENKGATVAAASTGTATLTEKSTGTLTAATATAPPYCTDAFGRFKVNTRDCSFEQHQSFRVSAVTVRGVDGKSRFEKQRIEELDPVTGLPIPGGDSDLALQFAITEEKSAAPGPWHQRLVAAVNERGSFGAGLKFFSLGSFDASVLGFYDVGHKAVRGALQPGWRLRFPAIDSTISIGPNVYIDSTGNSGVGLGATIELTR